MAIKKHKHEQQLFDYHIVKAIINNDYNDIYTVYSYKNDKLYKKLKKDKDFKYHFGCVIYKCVMTLIIIPIFLWILISGISSTVALGLFMTIILPTICIGCVYGICLHGFESYHTYVDEKYRCKLEKQKYFNV